jgi:hypothetical protein
MQRPKRNPLNILYLLLLILIGAVPSGLSQTVATNWAAFNDHRGGLTTHPNATTYDMRQTGDGGLLKDYYTGLTLPVRLIVRHEGTLPDDFGGNGYPLPGTPANLLFTNICEIGNNGIVPVRNRATGPASAVIFTFTNLDSSKKYIVAGTSTRGNNYAGRWTIATLQGVSSFQNAHQGVGVYTNGTGTIQPGQAAWQSGENRANGALVSWSEIDPGPDGTFSIRFDQYIDNPLPNGSAPDLATYGYAFSVLYLAEVGPPVAPMFIDSTQPTNRVVVQNRSTTLSAIAAGSPPPSYQWYHDGVAIDPAANPTARSSRYVITRMSAADAGDYYCVASNPAGVITSRTATVGYLPDMAAPRVVRAVGSASLTTITVEFDEEMDTNTTVSAFAYTISPSLSVLAVTNAPGDRSFIITTDPQTPDTVYSVTVGAGEVYDYAGNPIAGANNTAEFRSFISSPACSGVLFEGFDVDVGSANVISSLTNHPNFLNGNSFTNVFINRMHSRAVQADNARENYGGRMRTLFIPLVSGNWRFYMSSDDPGELWFNPAGSGASGRTLVARELACCNLYQAAGAPQTSQVFPLTAGNAYYLELLYKEGGGGDFGSVAARLDGSGLPGRTDGPGAGGNDQTGEPSEAIGSVNLPSPFCTVGYGYVPANAAGTISISQQPASVSTEANRRLVLNVGVSTPDAPYVCYQWQRSDDGGATFNDIPGAIRSSYTTPYLTVADDNQDQYRLVIGIPGAQVTSAVATLTVTADVTRPRITSIFGISSTQIALYFSEPMSGGMSTATDAFSYEMDQAITVGEAVQNPSNPLRIDLTVSLSTPMTLGTVYELTASTQFQQLLDTSGNAIDPDPTRISFRAQNYDGNVETLVNVPVAGKRPLGSLTERGFKGRLVHIAGAIVNTIANAEQMLAGTYLNPVTGQPYPNMAAQPNFVESNIIDYYGNGTDAGHILPNGAFPGLSLTAENFAFEALTYLELYKGVYRMGVNSDDNFRVSPASSVSDPNNAVTLGIFDGNGRAQADTIFDFYVSEDGLYPFRLVFEQGQGGFGLEWFIRSLADAAGTYIAVNGTDDIKAFVPPSTAVPSLAVTHLGGTMIRLSWTDSEGLYQLQSSLYLDDPAWSNVSGVSVTGDQHTKDIDTTGYPYEFYRLRKP